MADVVYGIVFKSSGQMVTTKEIQKVWPNYGSSAYKVSRKIYWNLANAKSGFSHLPDRIKPYLKIQPFVPATGETGFESIDGEVLMQEQAARKAKIKQREDKKLQDYRQWLDAKPAKPKGYL